MEILGGLLFAVAGAGESHGPAITTIVFGCPAGLELSCQAVQTYLDRRRPGSNKHGTPRHEADKVVFLSGLFNHDLDRLLAGSAITVQTAEQQFQTPTYQAGFTTGEPIAALVLSAATKSNHYAQFAGASGEVRPGHTDLVKYYQSGGFADYRGGGRSSYRSTISDVIGGSIARLFLAKRFGTAILSSIYQVGELQAKQTLTQKLGGQKSVSPDEIRYLEENLAQQEIYSIDCEFAHAAAELIKQTRLDGNSIGAAVEVVAVNVPPLVGEPLYQSLKLRLMGSLGGLHAVQACEIGDGWGVVERRGSENNDFIRQTGYQTNHHGGLLGGITTGMPLICRVGFKPTATITKPQLSVRKNLAEIDFQLQQGRHDPCVGVRAGVTLESRLAIELLNAVLAHQAHQINEQNFRLF